MARAISEAAGLTRGVLACRPGLRIMLYHAVGSRLEHDDYGISIAPDLFDRHMATLAENKDLSLVSLSGAASNCAGLQVALTFDDGYKDNLRVAAPILLKHGIPFTVFVTSSFVQSKSPLYLDRTDLLELAALPGVTIGSHGATHVRLAQCDEAELWREMDGSRCSLEDMLGKAVTTIAYPHGSVNRRVRDVASQAGYTLGVCSRFDINDGRRDPLLFCRTEIVAADSERVFLQKLRGVWDWYRWRTRDVASEGPTS